MQIFEQKSTTKNGISLYSTKYNISKIAARRSRDFRLKVRGERAYPHPLPKGKGVFVASL